VVDCPDCNPAGPTPTPTPVHHTLPPTDTIANPADDAGGSNGALIAGLLGLIGITALFLLPLAKRRR
jgi:hypothetical protein